jgi:hypothetical protein
VEHGHQIWRTISKPNGQRRTKQDLAAIGMALEQETNLVTKHEGGVGRVQWHRRMLVSCGVVRTTFGTQALEEIVHR